MITALIISLLTFGVLGYVSGICEASSYWSGKITEATLALEMSTYRMAWTNTRACVLAVDSAAMRFVSSSTSEDLNDLINRYQACEAHWLLLRDHTPDAQSKSSLHRAYWEFTNWWGQLQAMLEIKLELLDAQRDGDMETSRDRYDMLMGHKEASRRYRDRIESKLFEAW